MHVGRFSGNYYCGNDLNGSGVQLFWDKKCFIHLLLVCFDPLLPAASFPIVRSYLVMRLQILCGPPVMWPLTWMSVNWWPLIINLCPPPPWHTLWTCLNSTTPHPYTHTPGFAVLSMSVPRYMFSILGVHRRGLIDSGHACVATPTSIRTSSSSTPSTTDHDSVQQPGWDSSSNVKQAQGRSCMTWVAHTSLICMTFINVLY